MNEAPFVGIKAGKEAFEVLSKKGLSSSDISGMSAAAGGPKWFTVYGLTRYLIGDLLKDAQQELHFTGASVGSWQMAAALTSNPTAAIDRLRDTYAGYIYDDEPGPQMIERACRDIINSMVGAEAEHILDHRSRSLHVITSRGKGWLSHQNKVTKSIGFGYSFVGNAVSRKRLDRTAQRTVFSSGRSLAYDVMADVLSTTHVQLTKDNLLDAMLASGSIPYISPGVSNIEGAPKGTYWDGGLTDYHISLPYVTDGLILHPHFFPFVYAGWFDKKLPWRRVADPINMSKVVLIYPSEAFIQSLPKKRITDMEDFYEFGEDQEGRCQYWKEVSQRSLELGEQLHDLITSGDIMKIVEPY